MISITQQFALTVCILWTIPSAQCEFTQPRTDVDDLKQSWTVGDTMKISWNKGWDYGVFGDQPDRLDLWITWFDLKGFTSLLTANVSLDNPGNLNWKVNITNEIASASQEFVLRFMEATDPPKYPDKGPMLPSKGFYIYPNDGSSTSSNIPSSSTSAPSGTQSTSTSQATPSQSDPTEPRPGTKKKTSNTGAIAGGVLGGLVGIAVVLGGVLALLRRMRKGKDESVKEIYSGNAGEQVPQADQSLLYRHEVPEFRSELPGSAVASMHKPPTYR